MVAADFHGRRDIRLAAEAEAVVKKYMAKWGPAGDEIEISLRVQLELQIILCDEYR
jgi:hypothetical protein